MGLRGFVWVIWDRFRQHRDATHWTSGSGVGRPPRRRSEDPSEPAVVPATLHLPACTGPHVPQAAAVTGAVGTGRGRPWSPKICHTVGLIGDLARQTHARADTVVPTLECATSMPDFCTPSRTPPAAPRAGLGPLSPTFSPTRIPEEPFSHSVCSSPHAAEIWALLVSTTLCADAADENSGMRPSTIVGCVRTASRSAV